MSNKNKLNKLAKRLQDKYEEEHGWWPSVAREVKIIEIEARLESLSIFDGDIKDIAKQDYADVVKKLKEELNNLKGIK